MNPSNFCLLCRCSAGEEDGLPDLLRGKFHVFSTTSGGVFWGYRLNSVFIFISDPSISSSFSALISMSINKKKKMKPSSLLSECQGCFCKHFRPPPAPHPAARPSLFSLHLKPHQQRKMRTCSGSRSSRAVIAAELWRVALLDENG